MNKSKTNVSIIDNAGIRRKASVIVGNEGSFQSGVILDANATEELINGKVNNAGYLTSNDISSLVNSVSNIQGLIDADESDIDLAIDKFEEIVEFLDGIEPGSELYTIIHSHIDNGISGVIKHVEVLTQDQYDALATKDANTEYNIIESV